MRITNEHITRLIGARVERVLGPGKEARAESVNGARGDGLIFLSARCEEVRAGMAAARAATGSDDARLAALQVKVARGQYRPPAEGVAESMLRDMGK